MAARFALALALCIAASALGAHAQQYQTVHVRSFTLTSDTQRPQLERPFHVTLTIRVAENVSHIDNVYLPTFFGAEEYGDQHEIVHGPGGATYRETLTLVAHGRGRLTISPAYMDAVDARDGKPKRFVSNALQLNVAGGPLALWAIFRSVVSVVLDLVLFAAALFVIAAIFWRRRRTGSTEASAQVHEYEAPQEPPARNPVAQALDDLAQRRDRLSLLRLRAELWRTLGANAGETLRDVLRRPGADEEHTRRMLMLVERAAFIEDDRLHDAIDDVLAEKEWTFAYIPAR